MEQHTSRRQRKNKLEKIAIIGILFLIMLVTIPNAKALIVTEPINLTYQDQGTASEGEGVGIKVYTTLTLLYVNKLNSSDTSTRVYVQNAARNSNISNASFNGTSAAFTNIILTNGNGTSGTKYYIVTNANGSIRQTWGLVNVTYPRRSGSGAFNWSEGVLNDAVGANAAFGIVNITIDDGTIGNPVVLIDPTPTNNSVEYYSNDTLIIKANASVIAGNTTIRFYDNTGTILYTATNNSNTTTLTITDLAVGEYWYNASWTNGTISNTTETRKFTIYILTSGSLTFPSNGNGTNVTRYLDITYTNGSLSSNNITTINISYDIYIYNSTLILNQTIGRFTNNSMRMYDTFLNQIPLGTNFIVLTTRDSRNNTVNQTTQINHTANAEYNISVYDYITGLAITSYNLTINNTENGLQQSATMINTNVTFYVVNGTRYEGTIYTDNYATQYPNLGTFVTSFTNNTINRTSYNVTYYLLPIRFDLWFTQATNVTAYSNYTVTQTWTNVTNITLTSLNWSNTNVYIEFNTFQKYYIATINEIYNNITLYVIPDLSGYTTVEGKIVSTNSPLDGATLELKEAYNGGYLTYYKVVSDQSGAVIILEKDLHIVRTVVGKEGYENLSTEKYGYNSGNLELLLFDLESLITTNPQARIYNTCPTSVVVATQCKATILLPVNGQALNITIVGQNGYTQSNGWLTTVAVPYINVTYILNSSQTNVTAYYYINGISQTNITKWYINVYPNITETNNGTVNIPTIPEGDDNTETKGYWAIAGLVILMGIISIIGYLEAKIPSLGWLAGAGILVTIAGAGHWIFYFIGIPIWIYAINKMYTGVNVD